MQFRKIIFKPYLNRINRPLYKTDLNFFLVRQDSFATVFDFISRQLTFNLAVFATWVSFSNFLIVSIYVLHTLALIASLLTS